MHKLANFKQAIESFHCIYEYDEPYGKVELAGIVALFEVCFKLSWKAIKAVLEAYGYPEGQTGSPKTVLKTAHKAGMVNDEDAWVEALIARNNVARSYNQDAALSIARATKGRYFAMFCELAQELEENWS